MQRLIAEAESRGLQELTTEASEFSKPLFEKFGFAVCNLEYTHFKGVDFTRYAMRKFKEPRSRADNWLAPGGTPKTANY